MNDPLTGVPTVPCKFCYEDTINTGTRRCDRCWEIEHRIQHEEFHLVQRILGECGIVARSSGESSSDAFNKACLQEPRSEREAKERLHHEKTGRGFDIVRIDGERAADLEIQESSVFRYEGVPGSSALWFKVVPRIDHAKADSAHLDFHLVEQLHALLGRWIKTGQLE